MGSSLERHGPGRYVGSLGHVRVHTLHRQALRSGGIPINAHQIVYRRVILKTRIRRAFESPLLESTILIGEGTHPLGYHGHAVGISGVHGRWSKGISRRKTSGHWNVVQRVWTELRGTKTAEPKLSPRLLCLSSITVLRSEFHFSA